MGEAEGRRAGRSGALRRLLLWGSVAAGILLLGAPFSQAWGGIRIAVVDFSVNGAAPHLGEAAAEILRTEMSGRSGLDVVERARLDSLAREHKLQLSGLVDQATAVKVGKLLGANYVLVGAVSSIGKVMVLTARLVDVQRGTSITGFKSVSEKGEDGLYAAIETLTGSIVEQMGSSFVPGPPVETPTPGPGALPTPSPGAGVFRPEPSVPLPGVDVLPEGSALQWDLRSEKAWQKADSEGTPSSGGFVVRIRKAGWCTSHWIDIPPSLRRKNHIAAEVEIGALVGDDGGVSLENDHGGIYLSLAPGGLVALWTVGDSYQKLASTNLAPPTFPCRLRLEMDLAGGMVTGFLQDREVVRVNLKQRGTMRLVSVQYVGLRACADQNGGETTFRTLRLWRPTALGK